jgi:energy-coupling factor transporter transmembrane protein EcfT
MMPWRNLSNHSSATFKGWKLSVVSYLAIFACSLTAVILTPAPRLPWVAGGCLLMAALLYPQAFHALMRLRWLAMIGLLALPPLFLVGETDRDLFGIPYSSEGWMSAVQIVLRILVLLVSVQGLTAVVDITSIAGLLERVGLRGLGFSMGVALNILPALFQSAQNAWRTLWMRGGLRKKRWHALHLFAVAVVANALNRAEEIAVAAEARGYSPERSVAYPIKNSKLDWLIITVAFLSIGIMILIR